MDASGPGRVAVTPFRPDDDRPGARRCARRRPADGQPHRPAAGCRRHDARRSAGSSRHRRGRPADRVPGRGHRRVRRVRCGTRARSPARPTAPRYAGAPLTSRTKVSLARTRVGRQRRRVRVERAVARSRWVCCNRTDWGAAKWIHLPPPPLNRGVTYDVGEQDGALRPPRRDQARPRRSTRAPTTRVVNRIQLAEMQVLAPDGTNLALNKTVSAFDQFPSQGWGTRQLTDGRIISPGYMSRHLFQQDASPSKWVQVDLGSVQRFNKIVLYPRSDSRTPDGQIPNFPVDFTFRTSSTSSTPATRDQDRHRPAEPARARPQQPAADLRARLQRRQAGQPRRACTSPASAPTTRPSTASRSPTRCSTPA